MRLVLVTPPDQEVLSLAEAKAHLRVDSNDEDEVITACVAAAVGEIDAAAGGWLGRALRPQVWELRLSSFPGGCLKLPCPPLIAVEGVDYVDSAGATIGLVEGTDYRVVGEGSTDRALLAPVYGKTWPSARCDHDSVVITFQAGYPDALPPAIVQWVKLRAGRYYEYRHDEESGAVPPPSKFTDNLLAPLRVW